MIYLFFILFFFFSLYFLRQHECMLTLTLCHLIDLSLPGSSVHRIFPSKYTGVGCHALLRGSSRPRDRTHVSHVTCTGRQALYHWRHLGRPQAVLYQDFSCVHFLCFPPFFLNSRYFMLVPPGPKVLGWGPLGFLHRLLRWPPFVYRPAFSTGQWAF